MNFHSLPKGNYPISVKYMPRGEDGDIYIGELRSLEDVVMNGGVQFLTLYFLGDVQLGVKISKCITAPKGTPVTAAPRT